MTWSIYELIAAIAASMLVALVLELLCLHLFRRHREAHLALWSLSAFVWLVRHVFVLSVVANPKAVELALYGDQMGAIVSVLFFCWGSYVFLRSAVSLASLLSAALCLIVSLGLLAMTPAPAAILPSGLFAVGLSARTASLFLSDSDIDRFCRRLVAVGLLIFSTQVLLGPFLVRTSQAAVWRLLVSNLAYTVVGLGILLIYFDRMREDLDESRERFRDLFEASLDGILICEEGTILEVNPSSEWMFGYRTDELVGMPIGSLIESGDQLSQPEMIPSDALRQFESTCTRKDGSKFDADIVVRRHIYQGRAVVVMAVRDISSRKRMYQALRQSERRLRDVLENVHLIAATLDGQGNITFCNDYLLRLTGWQRDEVIGRNWFDTFVPPETRDLLKQRFARNMTTGEAASHTTNELMTRDGRRRMISWNITMLFDDQGKVIGTASIGEDITERQRAEQELAAERERLAVTLRSIGDGVIATDVDGKVVLLNRVAEALTGWREEEAIGMPSRQVFSIIDQRTREPCVDPVKTIVSSGKPLTLPDSTILIAKDGTERIIAHSAAPIRNAQSEVIGVVVVFHDITEQRKMQEELQKANKLEAVGLLAGGIAHDFNNLLTAIAGNVALAAMTKGIGGEVAEILSEAEKAAVQAKELTQQLLTFAKGGAPIRKAASLVELLESSSRFALRGSNVRCRFDLPQGVWPVEIDKGQINQVLNNLLINAQEAMPNGGSIKVAAANLFVGAGEVPPLPPGRYVKVTVEDEGIGIPPENLGRIFDPYFTTKERGSGLGLATSYSIVKKHNGLLTVESEPGKGAAFHMYLPASDEQPKQEEEKKVRQEAPPNGRGRVLIMDDDPMIRRLAQRLLGRLGYEVEAVEDGAAAINTYIRAREAGRPFDVVITDLTVPGGMGGKETAERLRRIDPQAKVIVSSGYSIDPVMAEYEKYGFCGMVTKPYQLSELGKVVYTVITDG